MADRITELSNSGWIAEHREQYLQDGQAGHLWDASMGGGSGRLPTLLLLTKGRKSGRESVMPLLYGTHGEGYAVIASRGGDKKHPGWYHNLRAQSRVGIKLKDDTFEATTRIASGPERETIWAQMVELYAPFADYALKAAPREIPVVILERAID